MGEPHPALPVGGYLEPGRAVGAVLWRDGTRGREVALVGGADHGGWRLPGSGIAEDAHPLTSAVRAVGAATGVAPVLGRRLPSRTGRVDGWPTRTEWWAAVPAEDPDPGADAVWTPLAEARDRLGPAERGVLDDFRAGAAATVPLVVLRHATAGDKHEWDGDDLLRPLDGAGRADASALAEALGAFGSARVLSSAAARCVETVLPYAVAHSVEVRTEHAFTVESGSYDRQAARSAVTGLLAARRPAVVCTHGELVADLMEAVSDRLGAVFPRPPSLRKGEFWVVHVAVDGGRLAAVERHRCH